MNTPILETERLILRPFEQNDAETVFECWESDPEVAKYMFWTSHNDIEKTKEWISFEVGQIPKDDWYRFALVTKDTNDLIGTGLIYYEDEVKAWEIIGGLHLKMPDSIADEKVLKRPLEKNIKLVNVQCVTDVLIIVRSKRLRC